MVSRRGINFRSEADLFLEFPNVNAFLEGQTRKSVWVGIVVALWRCCKPKSAYEMNAMGEMPMIV
jgi:hypothetical protein